MSIDKNFDLEIKMHGLALYDHVAEDVTKIHCELINNLKP